MQRKTTLNNLILIVPCVLLSLLTSVIFQSRTTIINILITIKNYNKILFWLPPESSAKMVLGMNIFTSFFLLLLLLSKSIPSATENIPLIGAYYCLNMMVVAVTTIACTLIVHIYYRGESEVPWILRKIFLIFLAKIFLMKPPSGSKKSPTNPNFDHKTADFLEKSHQLKAKHTKKSKSLPKRPENFSILFTKQLNQDLTFSVKLIRNQTKEMRDYISHVQKKIANVDTKLKYTKDWKQIALIIDRLLFFLYLSGIAIGATVLLF